MTGPLPTTPPGESPQGLRALLELLGDPSDPGPEGLVQRGWVCAACGRQDSTPSFCYFPDPV